MQRIEPARLGHVFVCSFGGSRYGISGCRRSYLSQRDLHAHIKRRHQAEGSTAASDLSGEFAADLKRSEMPAYPNPMPAGPILRETLPPQTDRPFAGMVFFDEFNFNDGVTVLYLCHPLSDTSQC